jgi:hypothetical protein
MAEVEARVELHTTVSVRAEAQVKHSFSRQHFRAARYFAEKSHEIEQEIDRDTNDETVKSVHRSYVTGAVISVVAGLESSINELYLEACDNNRNTLVGLNENAIAMLAEWWENIESCPILLKYQTALLLTSKEKFDRGARPYQDIDGLVRLRNALVHYKPEWDSELQVHEDLRNRLESRFQLNPFAAESSLWFPHRCLGSGCAMWAVDVSETFITDFCGRMGIPTRI